MVSTRLYLERGGMHSVSRLDVATHAHLFYLDISVSSIDIPERVFIWDCDSSFSVMDVVVEVARCSG